MKSKMTINECGDKFWKLPGGKYHREDGPAVVLPSGGKSWYLNNIICLSVFFPKIIPSIGYRCDHQSIKNIVKISSVELKTVFI